MKKIILFSSSLLLSALVFAQRTNKAIISLIPQPASIVQGKGVFVLPKDLTIISFSYDQDAKRIATQMANRIGDAT
ncbi:MAG TPA: hypothetical protein VHM26_17590, partial [Chitinophagaceae bacterium]|nr:hypothetical protein [Chitinophagaceae bacterium]